MPTDKQAGKTLLVVEDDAATREGLALILEREGYALVLAAHGQEALARLLAGPSPDLILLDMLMPVLDGWHFLRRMRLEGPRPAVPVVILTATILTREWAKDHGCQGFLHKPFAVEPLLEEVRRCLG